MADMMSYLVYRGIFDRLDIGNDWRNHHGTMGIAIFLTSKMDVFLPFRWVNLGWTLCFNPAPVP